MEITILIPDKRVRQALKRHGDKVTDERVAEVMAVIAATHFPRSRAFAAAIEKRADEIVNKAIEILADEKMELETLKGDAT